MGRFLAIIALVAIPLGAAAQEFVANRSPQETRISLQPGFVGMIRIPQTLSSVVVGNPDVVEALPSTDRILTIRTKAVGVTNILGTADGIEVVNIIVSVRPNQALVQSHSRAGPVHQYWSYQCTPLCTRVEDKLEGAAPLPAAPPGTVFQVLAPGASGSAQPK